MSIYLPSHKKFLVSATLRLSLIDPVNYETGVKQAYDHVLPDHWPPYHRPPYPGRSIIVTWMTLDVFAQFASNLRGVSKTARKQKQPIKPTSAVPPQ